MNKLNLKIGDPVIIQEATKGKLVDINYDNNSLKIKFDVHYQALWFPMSSVKLDVQKVRRNKISKILNGL